MKTTVIEARTRYSGLAQAFHWLTALLVLTALPLGLAMLRVEGDWQNTLFDLHRSFGATILAVATFRVVYRLFRMPVAPAPGVPEWQSRIAEGVHWTLYALLLATPIIGWAGTSAYRAPVSYFGLFTLPPILPENRAVSEALLEVHGYLAFAIIGLLVVHIGAALHHHFIVKDDTLRRMLPSDERRRY